MGLDFDKKENRKKLIKEIKKILKIENKPTLEELRKIRIKMEKKFGIKIQCITKFSNEKYEVSVKVGKQEYSIIRAKSEYEYLCKFILLIKTYVLLKKRKEKT